MVDYSLIILVLNAISFVCGILSVLLHGRQTYVLQNHITHRVAEIIDIIRPPSIAIDREPIAQTPQSIDEYAQPYQPQNLYVA